ncbi:MAG: FkbM family methyltransferase [Patescibacteria group bacterium]
MKSIKKIVEQPRPFRFIISFILLRLNLFVPIRLIFYKGNDFVIKTRLYPSSATHQIFTGRNNHNFDFAIFRKYIQKDSVVFDVGANIGLFSIFFAKLAPLGKVYALEATESSFIYLIKNIAQNTIKNIFPIYGAVSDTRGTVSFFEHTYSHEQDYIDISGTKGKAVLALRLDDAMQMTGVSQIDFLKIDIEGGELMALKSLGERIKDVEVIYFECMEKHLERFGYTRNEIVFFLEDNNFVVHIPTLGADGDIAIEPYAENGAFGRDMLAFNKKYINKND